MGKRYTSRDVVCSFCGAAPGESCRGSVRAGRGHRAVGNHNSRIQAAQALNAEDLAAHDAEVRRAVAEEIGRHLEDDGDDEAAGIARAHAVEAYEVRTARSHGGAA